MVFAAAGLLMGTEVLGFIDLSPLGDDVQTLAEATLAVVLFSDASRIDVRALRGEAAVPARLLGVGLPLTIVAGFVVALPLFGGLGWAEALLLAVILAPTDAALGQAVVMLPRLPSRVRQSLNVESGLNDGICVPVFLVVLAVASVESDRLGASSASGWSPSRSDTARSPARSRARPGPRRCWSPGAQRMRTATGSRSCRSPRRGWPGDRPSDRGLRFHRGVRRRRRLPGVPPRLRRRGGAPDRGGRRGPRRRHVRRLRRGPPRARARRAVRRGRPLCAAQPDADPDGARRGGPRGQRHAPADRRLHRLVRPPRGSRRSSSR